MKNLVKHLFSYKGRISRKTYLLYHILGIGGYFTFAYLSYEMFFDNINFSNLHPELKYLVEISQLFLGCLGVPIIYGMIPVSIKRYHDLNKSGFKYLIWSCLIPSLLIKFSLISGTLLLYTPSDSALLRYFSQLYFMGIAYVIVSFVVLSFLPGTKGENKYGSP